LGRRPSGLSVQSAEELFATAERHRSPASEQPVGRRSGQRPLSRNSILWPEFLIDAASRGECVLFVGAGVSRHAKQSGSTGKSPVGWKDLLTSLLDEIVPPRNGQRPRIRTQIKSKISAGDYLGAAQAIEA